MSTETSDILHIRLEGRVQGVGFRAWIRGEACARGLGGWVRNRRDGTLEALFVGPPHALKDMRARCREGPALSRVTHLEALCREAETPPFATDPNEGAPRTFSVLKTV